MTAQPAVCHGFSFRLISLSAQILAGFTRCSPAAAAAILFGVVLFALPQAVLAGDTYTFPTFNTGAFSGGVSAPYTKSLDVSGLPASEYLMYSVTAEFAPGAAPNDAYSNEINMELNNGGATVFKVATSANSGGAGNSTPTTLCWTGVMSRAYTGGGALTIKFFDSTGTTYIAILSNVVVTLYPAPLPTKTFATLNPGVLTGGGAAYTQSLDVTGLPTSEYLLYSVTADFVPTGGAYSGTLQMELNNGGATAFKVASSADTGASSIAALSTTLRWTGVMSRTYTGGGNLTIKFVDTFTDASGPYTSTLSNVVVSIYPAPVPIKTFATFNTTTITGNGTAYTKSLDVTGLPTSEYLLYSVTADYVPGSSPYDAWSSTLLMEFNNGGSSVFKVASGANIGVLPGAGGTVLRWTGVMARTYTGGGNLTIKFYDTFTDASGPYTSTLNNVVVTIYPAESVTSTISGNAGVAGATLSYTDGTAKTATADGTGAYSFPVSYNWSGTVIPSSAGSTFTPTSRTYTNVTVSQTAQNYVSNPTVTTQAASAIAATSATGNGNITATGGANATARGALFWAYNNTDQVIGDSGVTNVTEAGSFGTGAFTASLTGLSVNTQFNARAYATSPNGTGYGARVAFWTLANVPSAPTVNGPTATTLNVAVNANGNPASTVFCIQETSTGNYVQSDGSLGVGQVWQNAATWGTKTVTGLTAGSTQTFQVKARNGAATETGFGATASGVPVAAPTVTTQAVSGVTATTATGNGTIAATNGANATVRGVIYWVYTNTDKLSGDAGVTDINATGSFGTGALTASLTSLSVNTQYNARAYAASPYGTGYGARVAFWTLANVPSAPTISTPTATTLNVAVNANGNPASTVFCIQETSTGNYVQAGGSLGAGQVWQNAAAWGTKTVTGLTAGSTYAFQVKARNGLSTETAYGATASGVPVAVSVTSILPASGSTLGGTSVVVTGTGFTGASAVLFGSTAASSYTVDSATQITAISPVHAAGVVDITVTAATGTSAIGASDQFTYIAAPTALTVTSYANSGPGSLREAIDLIDSDGIITFGPGLSGQTVILTSTLGISRGVTIDGSALATPLKISGNSTIAVFDISSGATVTFARLDIIDGIGFIAGGIYNRGTLTVLNCAVKNNTGTYIGGIFNEGTLSIEKSTISGNAGGGIYNETSGTLALLNSTVSGNQIGSFSVYPGLAIVNAGQASLNHCTIVNNIDSGGGAQSGIHCENGALTLHNSIVANNGTDGLNNFSVTSGTFTSQGYNLCDVWNGRTTTTDDLTGAPLIAALADNGGGTQTHALQVGSPAYNGADTISPPATDQRGIARPQVGRSDIGAYEIEAAVPTIGTPPSDAIGTALGNTSFTVAATGISLSYQWQVDSGSGFVNITNGGVYGGATTTTLALSGMPRGMNGYSYRVVVTSAGVVSTTSSSAVLTVNQASQTISFGALGNKTYGDASFALSATADSGLAVAFFVVSGPASLSGNTVTLTGVGLVTIRASQAGDTNYAAATNVDRSFTVAKAAATVTLASLSQTYNGSARSATATTSPGSLTVDFTYDGSATAPAAAGSYTVVGTINDTNYAGTNTATLVIAKATPVVSWTTPSVITYGTALSGTQLNATANVAGAFVYTPASGAVLNTGINQLLSVTFTSTDTANYNNAAGTTTITVNKAAQAITFGVLGNKTSGDASFVLSATADSGLAVTFSVVSGPATLSGNTVTLTGSGTVTIRASQAGNANFSAATAVDQSFIVVPPAPSTPDLVTASDSGSSNTDNITNLTTPTFTGTGEANSTVQLFRGGSVLIGSTTADGSGNWSITVSSSLGDGTYGITAKATNSSAQTSVASGALSIEIDATASAAPAITAIANDTGVNSTDHVTSDTTLVLGGTAAANETVTVYRNAAPIGTATADSSGVWSFDYTGTMLAGGIHTFSAQSTDIAGNISVSSAAFLVEIDIATPSAPVITGIANDTGVSATDGITNDATLILSGTAEANAMISISRSGVGVIGTALANTSGVWSFDYSATTLPDGAYLFTAFATDTAGNASTVSGDFPVTIDTTAPAITNQPVGGTYTANGSFTLSVAVTDASALSYQWYLGASALGNTSNRTGSTTASVIHTGIGTIGSGGNYTVLITDLAGNSTTSNVAVVIVNKADQTISFPAIADQLTTVAPFSISAIASSGFGVTLSVVSGPATINGNIVTVTGAGSVTIRASQAGDLNYNAAPSVDRTFAVTKAVATVTLGSLSQTYDATAKSASAVTTPAGLTVNLTYDGSATPPTNAGSYAVVATVSDAQYQGTAAGTLTIAKSNQTVTFTSVGTVTVGTPVALSATASSGLSVTFSLLSGNATVSGANFTANNANAITLRATQAGNANYNAATADQVVSNITKIAQTIAFAALADKSHSAPAFSLSASATSSLPVTFIVQSGPATLSGTMLTLNGLPGTVTIIARQAGDGVYAAASDVSRSFAVSADYTAAKPDGYASVTTGGAAGASVVVLTAADFRTQATSTTACVITVVGQLSIGTVNVASNKTIQGADASAALVGNLNLNGVTNIIIRGLNLTNPGTTVVSGAYTDGGDALTITGSSKVFVTHCTFFDCADHDIKIVSGSDDVTVSWCEFYASASTLLHRYGVQIGTTNETQVQHVTLHHNWWTTSLDQHMPFSSYGHVHQYNNYVNATGNTAGAVASDHAQFLSERNVFANVASPLTKNTVSIASFVAGQIRTIGNLYTTCTGTTADVGTDIVFTPNYSYEMLPTSDVATEVAAAAGNTAGAGYTDATTGTATITGLTAAITRNTTFTLTAVSSGFTPSGYQWRFKNVNIDGATSATYTVAAANASPDMSGTYTVAVNIASGDTVVSMPIIVTIKDTTSELGKISASGGGGAPSWLYLSILAALVGIRRFPLRSGRKNN